MKSDSEKIAAFDTLYAQAKEHFDEVVRLKQYPVDDDRPHYLYEAVMEQSLGTDVFQRMNAVIAKAAESRRRAQAKLDKKFGRTADI